MARQGRRGTILETGLVLLVCAAGLVLTGAGFLPPSFEAENWLVPALFLYAPVVSSLLRNRDLAGAGLEGTDWRRAGVDILVYSLVILPLFFAGWRVIEPFGIPVRLSFRLPPDWGMLFLWHFFGVALPEEVFFRGWLQERLDAIIGRKLRFLGADIGGGLFISALAFAAAHYVLEPRPDRLLVFFPALLFGYFRERSNSVFVPVMAHGAGNFLFLLFQVSAQRF